MGHLTGLVAGGVTIKASNGDGTFHMCFLE